jgi:hypothetical protein
VRVPPAKQIETDAHAALTGCSPCAPSPTRNI